MKLNYVNKIRGNISISTNKKTANVLDGSYKSIYKGKSLNFEDLREYVLGDNVKDIDWKASARSNEILIKQYIAERKHNILFIMDSNKRMKASTLKKDIKSEVSLYTAGVIAYLANSNGDYISSITKEKENIKYIPFKQGLYHLEYLLTSYEEVMSNDNNYSINELLDYVVKYISRRMIIFIITDIEGLESVDFHLLKMLTMKSDVLFINVNDNVMFDKDSYDLDNEQYIPNVFLNNQKLREEELKERKSVLKRCEKELMKYNISFVDIDGYQDIHKRVIELLERHKYAVFRSI